MSFNPKRLFAVLEQQKVEYILIGGLSAVLRGCSIATLDTDILVKRDLENLDRLATALNSMNSLFAGSFNAPAARPEPKIWDGGDFYYWGRTASAITEYGKLDMIFEAIGIGTYEDVLEHSEIWEIYEMPIRLASLNDVIASKEAADRPEVRAALPAYYELLKQQEASS